ncbi:ATP-binding protein [Herbaspirillum rubrisubalbicans]|uniref:histidine kinase n=1 Tax=Herbaspirillum rubrisubalbicans TaxID=80842 RepID=A0AAD0XG25_9BURK|nr:ATP-binding protein [Herbaspirillum rubrisubalbicans]AYR23239.1 two-component sensor histidine kinase [Herbaspirillum rubrisubalbicans]
MSIRNRLLCWLLSGLAVLSLLYMLADYQTDHALLTDIYDDQMIQVALSVPDELIQAPQRADAELPGYESDDCILQIWAHNGDLLYRTNRDIVLPPFSQAGFSTVHWHGAPWRIYVRKTGQHLVQVAQSLDGRREIAITHALHSLPPLLLFLLLMALFIRRTVDRSLHSLHLLSHQVAARSPDSLEQIGEHGHCSDVRPLAKALNSLLERLGIALKSHRHFIADASHELRTPLAALQIQALVVEQSLGSGQEQAALNDLKRGIQRTSHLVNQLLTVSRLENGALEEHHAEIDLHALVRQAVIDLLPLARSHAINLGAEQLDSTTVVAAPDQLGILVRNLIDNAVRYTPTGGQVDVSLHVVEGRALLEVEDSGPGIPVEERQRVFERFYRRQVQQSEGSGLGLAIVREIARQHGLRLGLDDSPRLGGLRVSVAFEISTRPAPRSLAETASTSICTPEKTRMAKI